MEAEMDFGNAIPLLRKGTAMRRRGWNEGEDVLKYVRLNPRFLNGTSEDREFHVGPFDYSEGDEGVEVWTPDPDDIFEPDWEVMPEDRVTTIRDSRFK